MKLDSLRSLITGLDGHGQTSGWSARQIGGGANGLLYYARRKGTEVAVKFYTVDAYERAGREYDALRVLQEANPTLAPRPLLFERDLCKRPVVVQSWLSGKVSASPPQTDEAWRKLLEHYVALSRIRPGTTDLGLKRTVLNARSSGEAKALVRDQLARLPEPGFQAGLEDLAQRLFAGPEPGWLPPADALCRGDSNLTNFVRGANIWRSLDWEYGGWGDPAFEIAELVTHPAYAGVPSERWPWVIRRYSEITEDDSALERIRTYLVVLAVWWMVRFARYLYEVPRGLDRRLVAFPDDFMATAERQYEVYRKLAERRLEGDVPL